MLNKAPRVTLIFSILFLSLFLLFTNVNLASAQVRAVSEDCAGKSAPDMVEILASRSHSFAALKDSYGVGSTPELRMTFINNPSPLTFGLPSFMTKSDAGNIVNVQADDSSSSTRITMFRLYNPWTGEHFYTSDETERDNTVRAGWNDEGTGWIAPSKSTTPVYRLYNPYVSGGDHHYTTNKAERDKVQAAGWNYEGIGWYSVDEGESDRVPIYRQYNPFAETGTHNYTPDKDENDRLVKALWKAEGISWYGYSKLTQEIDFSKAVVDQSQKTYCAKQITPSAKVTGLKAGTDYTVAYGANKEVGQGTITITGKGSYTGSKVYKFTINPLDISKNSTVTLGNSLTYNASKQTQTVSKVVASGITLSSTDYTVSGNSQANAGTYALKITAKGNFTGSINREFVIAPMDIKGATVTLSGSGQFAYDATEHVQEVQSVVVGKLTLSSSDYKLAGNIQVNAGTHTLEVQGKGNFTGTATKEFVITKKVVSIKNVTAKDKVYDGTADAEADVSLATLDTPCEGDVVKVKSAKGSFVAGKNVENNKKVTLTEFELDGDSEGNYEVVASEDLNLSANITPKEVSVTGITVQDRPYKEGNRDVMLQGHSKFGDGDICADDSVAIVSVSASKFADANAEEGKDVSLSILIGGRDSDNYVVSESSKLIKGNILGIVKLDTNCASTVSDIYVHVGKPFEDSATAQLPAREGLTIEGWYNNAACATDALNSKYKWDFSANYVSENITTLYANWIPTKDYETGNLSYWIAPSYIVTTGNTTDTINLGNNAADKGYVRDSYFADEWNVLKSSNEIKDDIEKIKSGDTETINEYNAIMANDKYHLYTAYNGGESEISDSGTTSPLNHYLEFRVVHVGQHLNVKGTASTADGSSLTFMAIRQLPTSYQMHNTQNNEGGWKVMDLRGKLQPGGEIYNKFNSSFINDVVEATKYCYPAGQDTDRTKIYTVNDKLWLFSQSEILGKGTLDYRSCAYEGSAYQWFVDMEIYRDSSSTKTAALHSTRKTRAGDEPGPKDEGSDISFSRTPFGWVGGTAYYQPYSNMLFSHIDSWDRLDKKRGVTLGFAF